MHFRDRGQNIQLVRTSYDKAAKKPKTEILGRLTRSKMAIDADLREKLTPDEVVEVESYIARFGNAISVELQYAAVTFPKTLTQVSNWLKTVDNEEAVRFFEEIQRPLTRLRRQLVKAADDAGDKAKLEI